jgi:hypothetical protein
MAQQRMGIAEKRRFLELRAQGVLIKECAAKLGFSIATCSRLEKKRKNGTLRMEILAADNPTGLWDFKEHMDPVLKMLSRCEKELAQRDIQDLPTPKLVAVHKTLLDTAARQYRNIEKDTEEPQDELDLIYAQVAAERGPREGKRHA